MMILKSRKSTKYFNIHNILPTFFPLKYFGLFIIYMSYSTLVKRGVIFLYSEIWQGRKCNVNSLPRYISRYVQFCLQATHYIYCQREEKIVKQFFLQCKHQHPIFYSRDLFSLLGQGPGRLNCNSDSAHYTAVNNACVPYAAPRKHAMKCPLYTGACISKKCWFQLRKSAVLRLVRY